MVIDNGFSYDFSAAAREGNLDVLQQLSKKDTNKRDEDGMTPVHWAALYGNLEALRIIIIGGGNPDKANNEGSTALHLSATNGQLHCLIFLTNFGGNVHAVNDVGDTPMHEASNKRRLECVRHLEAIVTHQVSQDRQKVEKMQQKAKRDAEKRIKDKTKYLQKLDRTFEKKSAKQRKYLGAPITSGGGSQNQYGSMLDPDDQSGRMNFSQLTGVPRSERDFNEYDDMDDESMSTDSFRRAEEEFMTRTSLMSDDIVFERTDKQSVVTDQSDLSVGSAEIPTKSAAMMASLNSLHSKNHNGRMNTRSAYNERMQYAGQTNNGKINNERISNNVDSRRVSVATSKSNNIRTSKPKNNTKAFGQGQRLGASTNGSNKKESMSVRNVPPSKRTGRPVGFVEVHMGPLYTFLHSLELDEFREAFLHEKIDLGACLLCDENDLREIGLPLGPRKKLIDAIRRRNQIVANTDKNGFHDSAV